MLEDRLAPASFTDVAPTLNVALDVAGDSVSITSVGAVYNLTLAAGNWIGTDTLNVIGSGTPTLTVMAAPFTQVNVTDAASTAVTFANTGAAYASTFSVTLDDTAAGTINFTGSSNFGPFNLSASTSRDVVNGGATVTTTSGNVMLSANQNRLLSSLFLPLWLSAVNDPCLQLPAPSGYQIAPPDEFAR